ncbi:hypothetical protein TNCV_4833821 [Trichonephila clavipes]|nr:hypothetical protein TNCV_4833821 [Trichonephila clavipes]
MVPQHIFRYYCGAYPLPNYISWEVDWARRTYCLAPTLLRGQSLGFLLLRLLKSLVYETPVVTMANFTARIVVASADICLNASKNPSFVGVGCAVIPTAATSKKSCDIPLSLYF